MNLPCERMLEVGFSVEDRTLERERAHRLVEQIGSVPFHEAEPTTPRKGGAPPWAYEPWFSTHAQSLGFTDTDFHDVSLDLTGLIVGNDYCVDLVATSSSGSADGGQQFLEGATAFAFTDDVTPTGATTATVAGDIDPAGEATTYFVAYGLASSEWCQSGGTTGLPATATNPQPLGFTDIGGHSVSVTLTGLSGATTYCADLIALNTRVGTSRRSALSAALDAICPGPGAVTLQCVADSQGGPHCPGSDAGGAQRDMIERCLK